jgi:hypothetical protein
VLVWELRACIGAIWEADGAIWEMCVPYGSQVHWIGAILEPDSTSLKEDGTIRESHMPLREPQHKTGAASAVWESDGTMWEPPVTYEDHMRAVCTVWVL